jgi:hypothetical protein
MLPDPAPTGRHDPLDGLRQRVPVQVAGETDSKWTIQSLAAPTRPRWNRCIPYEPALP